MQVTLFCMPGIKKNKKQNSNTHNSRSNDKNKIYFYIEQIQNRKS